MNRRLLQFATLLALLWLLAARVVFALAPAGELIINQAKAVYFDTRLGEAVEVLSNQSSVKVASVYAVDLAQNQNTTAAPGQTLFFIHTLQNRGNSSDTYELTAKSFAGQCQKEKNCSTTDKLQIKGIYPYRGALPNQNESPIDHTPTLAPDDKFELIVMAQVATTVSDSSQFTLAINASSMQDQNIRATNFDLINIGTTNLLLRKSSRPVSGLKETEKPRLEYQINFTNNGDAFLPERSFDINGKTTKGVLLEDPIPANTLLFYNSTPDVSPIQAQAVVKIGEFWYPFEQWQKEQEKRLPTRIGLLIPAANLRPGQSGKLKFQVKAGNFSSPEMTIYNQAGVDSNGDHNWNFISNKTVDTLKNTRPPGPGDSIGLAFMEPYDRNQDITFNSDLIDSRHYFLPDQMVGGASVYEDIYFRLKGSNFNQSAEAVETVDIQVKSGKTGATLTLRLKEEGNNKGIFRSLTPLRLTETDTGKGVCTTPNDQPDYRQIHPNCYLKSAPGDTLKAWVMDPVTHKKLSDTASIGTDGLVFDSGTMKPVQGAIVQFFDLEDQPAKPAHSGSKRPADLVRPQKTESDGRFLYPRMREGFYYIQVTPPDDYIFPSATKPEDYTSVRVTRSSYGKEGEPRNAEKGIENFSRYNAFPKGAFHYTNKELVNAFDVPLDPNANLKALELSKEALQEQVKPGEEVEYQLTVQNNSPYPIYNLKIYDLLPASFSYVEKSLQVNKKNSAITPGFKITADEHGKETSTMALTVNQDDNFIEIPANSSVIINYKLVAGLGQQEAINTAYATAKDSSGNPVRSDLKNAKVKVNLDGAIILEKEAKQKLVAPGELVGYELTIRSNQSSDVSDFQIRDTLPFGFKYVKNSLRVDGKKVNPLASEYGHLLIIPVTKLEAGKEIKVTYALKAGAGAIDSDGINRAVVQKNSKNISNEDTAQVTVALDGVLSDRAILFGKIYVDANCDGLQNHGEWPIGGVRLYMEDGTWAITDENGQYSLMGLKPGNHVVKVDPITMPDGLMLKPLDNRNGADGNSRFADLAYGEMHRADFAAICPQNNYQQIFAQIKARNESIAGDWLLDEAAQYDRPGKPSEQADDSGDLSHGLISQSRTKTEKPTDKNSIKGKRTAGKDYAIKQPSAIMPEAKVAVKSISRDQAKQGHWLWPTTPQADGRFMVVVRAGVTPSLIVNGEPVSQDRLGEQLLNTREQAQLLAWYGVPLLEGVNDIEVVAQDMFGNRRILAKGEFTQAGSATELKITTQQETLKADGGRSLLPITVELLDKNGLPARGVYFVTIESSAGRFKEVDIQDQTPGHQIRVENGKALVHLRSGNESGKLTLRASSGELSAEKELAQIAAPRPLIAVGIAELGASHGRVKDEGYAPSDLEAISKGYSLNKRTAFFIKGEVAEETQLTLSYDSDKDKDEELFRDVDPDDYYPITGDASLKGYEAQSRSKLYAKLEKNRSSLLWGDYQTDSDSRELDLARVQRTLNGLNAIYDTGTTRLQGFAARPEDLHREEVIQPNGTAMNYRLEGAPIVSNSETVTLEIFDRDNPGLIVETKTLSRGTDYTLDEWSGYLSFSEPIRSEDEQGRRQQIRVTYDLEGNGEEYTVAGIRAEQQLSEAVRVGLSHTLDEHKTEGGKVSGAWVKLTPTNNTTIELSTAESTTKEKGKEREASTSTEEKSGQAHRIRIEQKWQSGGDSSLTWAKAEAGFDNSSSGISAGREELRLDHKQRIGNGLDLRGEAQVSRSLDTDLENNSGEGDSVGLALDKTLEGGWKLTGGSRYIKQKSSDDNNSYATGLVGVEKRFKLLEKDASLKAEYEQAFTNPRWRTALEADWQVYNKTSIYGRFERDEDLSPVADGSDRNNFSFGVKNELLPNTRTYSEYRMRGATDGRNLEWVNGADSQLELEPGLGITPSIEWIQNVGGNEDNSNDGLALSMGISDKRQKNQRATGRVEYRHSNKNHYYGFDGAVARRLDLDWSGLVREEFNLELPRNGESHRRQKHIMTLGLARRPRLDNRHHGLYLYQWKEDRGENLADNRSVHLVSTHQNLQLSQDYIVSGRIGTKWVKTTLDELDISYTSFTTVADGRIIYDLDRRWDIDLRGGLLSVDGKNSVRWSAGFGVSYLVVKNLRVGAHYNFIGFRDKDLDSEKYNAQGLHLSMQFKFDESLFDWFKS